MQIIDSDIDLKDTIIQLESKQVEERKLFREQLHLAYESIKPINIIKSTLEDVATSKDLRDNLINTSVGVAAGYLTKMLFVGKSKNPLKKLLGSALLFGITNVVVKNPNVVKSLGKGLLNVIRNKSGKNEEAISFNLK